MRRSVRLLRCIMLLQMNQKQFTGSTSHAEWLLGSGLVPFDFAPIAKREGEQEHVSQVRRPHAALF